MDFTINFGHIISGLISIGSLLVAYLAFRDKRTNKSQTELEELKKELNCAKTKIYVLEERINTEISSKQHSLDKIEERLEQIWRML